MSAFIVISVKDNLNWIVDGIINSRPHNPKAETYISAGKIKKENNDNYLYEYAIYSRHASEDNTDETIKRTEESDIPRNLFKNQIAQFLNVSENDGGQINIFLLDNPISDEDFVQSTWITEEIKAVYDSHYVTNFQLTRVLFSYQIDKPTDVTRQVSKIILNKIQEHDLNSGDDFLSRILYIDNQNRNGAAICLSKEEHDIMLPRMLCDLMMLLTSKNDSYKATAAITTSSGMFAVGYSECMYYHDDIFRFFSIADKSDLLSYILYDKNSSVSLEYEREPFGLADRIHRLAPRYDAIPFDSDICESPESIDKEIDDILLSLKDEIINIRAQALREAAEKDRSDTKKAREDRLAAILASENEFDISNDGISEPHEAESEHTSNLEELKQRKGCNFLARLFHRIHNGSHEDDAKEVFVDPRVADIVITDETDIIKKKYPNFISRKDIYEQYLVEKGDEEFHEGKSFSENIKSYETLIKLIQSSEFKSYLKNSKDESSWRCLMKKINIINSLREERIRYEHLKVKAQSIKEDLEQSIKAVNDFRLTTHCSSVGNLIDVDKLKKFHAAGKGKRITEILKHWNEREEETRTLDSLQKDLAETIKWEIFGFYYIKWDKPFEFIKDIDLTSVCRHLKAKSQPFVNTYTLSPNADNLTTYCFYTDNPAWNSTINNGEIDLNAHEISSTLSTHICSKICMFQFLQMSQELIAGLVDCYDN